MQATNAKIVVLSMISNASSGLDNQFDLTTTVDINDKQLADVENQLGNNVSGVSSTSAAADLNKMLASYNTMMLKIKNVATTLKYRHKGDPTIGIVRPISSLSSVEKNMIKVMNQIFIQCQLISRECENLGSDSTGNLDTGKFSIVCEEHVRCSPAGKPASIRELENVITRNNANTGKTQ